MNAREVEDIFIGELSRNSGFDERRPYVGMSKAGNCPLSIYREFIDGTPANLDSHVGAWLGYTMESAALKLFGDRVKKVSELTAFDGMVRGHVEGEIDGDLLEIKSVTAEKLDRIERDRRPPSRHFFQVQAYMNYGNWRRCHILYVPRDYSAPMVLSVPFNANTADTINNKFSKVLSAIKTKSTPRCECGKCRGESPHA